MDQEYIHPLSPKAYQNFLLGIKPQEQMPKPQQPLVPPQVTAPPVPEVPVKRKPDWGNG